MDSYCCWRSPKHEICGFIMALVNQLVIPETLRLILYSLVGMFVLWVYMYLVCTVATFRYGSCSRAENKHYRNTTNDNKPNIQTKV
jgi:hypothetical protein